MLEEKMNNPFGDDSMDLGSSDFGGMFDNTDLDKLFGEDTPEPKEESKTKDEEQTPAEPEGTTELVQSVSDENTDAEKEVIKTETTTAEKEEVINEETTKEPAPEENAGPKATDASKLESDEDIYAAELAEAEKKETADAKSVLINKLPIFAYGKAKDDIVDTSITFEALRLEKAEDFPELDDGDNVSWKVTYGSISKIETTPKETTIASFKKKIEDSKDFPEAIKKA